MIKSLAVTSRSYQDVNEKLLYKPEHWIKVIVEDAITQDSLISELSSNELSTILEVY